MILSSYFTEFEVHLAFLQCLLLNTLTVILLHLDKQVTTAV